MTTIYLAGPIGGRENRNRDAFEQGKAYLTHYGCGYLHGTDPEVVTPFDAEPERGASHACTGKATGFEGDEHRYGCYLLACYRVLSRADCIAYLHDWDDSPGARAERLFAKALGIEEFQITLTTYHLQIGARLLALAALAETE